MGKITPKRRIFVTAYLQGFNATDAARQAGYKHPNKLGPRMLKDPDIQALINERLADFNMSADECLIRLSEIIRADISDFLEIKDGKVKVRWDVVKEKGYLLKRLPNWGDRWSIELHDKLKAIDLILKAYGMYSKRPQNEPNKLSVVGLDVTLERVYHGNDTQQPDHR